MKIGFFTDAYFPQPNGVATSVEESARALEKLGHEVTIIAPKYPGFKDKKNVIRLTSLKVYDKPEMRMALHLPEPSLRKVLSFDFDIIHAHGGGVITLLGWEVARSKNVPYVMTYHTLWNKYSHYFLKGKVVTPKMMERISRISGNRCDVVIAPTERVRKELVSYGVKRPIRVIPTGIEINRFENKKKGFLSERLRLTKEDKIILYVGRLGREKSVDFLIKAFDLVKESEPKAHLVLVGDGPDRNNFEKMVSTSEIGKRIHFLGFLDQSLMPKVYADGDIFAFASETETQGLVWIEALAAGLPIVSVKDPAAEAVVENGKNGILVETEKEFAESIRFLLKEKNHKEYSHYAKISARKHSVEKMAEDLEGLYQELLAKQSRDSITKVMRTNVLGEQFFIIHLFFWISILFMRFSIIFSYRESSLYPSLILGNVPVHHSLLGLFILFLGVVLYFFKRTTTLPILVLFGIGLGWLTDELWIFLTGGPFRYSDYWTTGNLLFILLLGVLPVFLVKIGRKPPLEFFFGERTQKFSNPEKPKVSVVIPAYNEEEFIASTLGSLLRQTYKNFEVIVVDNNSGDTTGDVARKFGAHVILEKKKGVAWARQTGFYAARGEIIATTDSDTVVPENWVETIVRQYEKKGVVGFGGVNRLYSGPVTARVAARYLSTAYWLLDKFLSKGWNMLGSNMSVKKDAFLAINGFRTDLVLGEDVDISQRLKTQGKILMDTNFLVFSSGRRFRNGLLMGVLTYAPSWAARVFFKKEKFLKFPTIRDENSLLGKLTLLPLLTAIVFLALLFYSFNPKIVGLNQVKYLENIGFFFSSIIGK